MVGITRCSAALVGVLAVACGGAPQTEEPGEDLWTQAERLARESIIVDTHIDVPYRLEEEMADVSEATEGGDFDYPRAVAGGLNAPFMSIYVPASLQETGGAKQMAEKLIEMVTGFESGAPTSSPSPGPWPTCASSSSAASSRCRWGWRTVRRSRTI